MERKIVQDVVPREKRTIRAITKEPKKAVPVERETFEYENVPPRHVRPPRQKKSLISKAVLSSIIIVSVIILAFAFSLVYASATIKITPKTEEVTVSGTYTAKKEAKATELQYEVMTLSKQRGEVVVATNGDHVETKARGTVTLYNAYSSAPQQLVVNTRLENTKGQIYRTDKAVTIPGYKTVDGRVVPGTVDVGVVASEPGSAYNLSTSHLIGDLKITAFKGDIKYEGFYARLKTDISGGYIGISKIIPPQVAETAKKKMREQLAADIVAEAKSQIPEGFVMFEDAFVIEYTSLPNTQKTTQEVILNEKATLYGVMFKKDTLNKHLASKELARFAKGKVVPEGIEDLQMDIQNEGTFNPKNGSAVTFAMKGSYKLVGTFPEDELKNKLKGTSVKDIGTVLSQYGTITSADVILRPFWKKTFPLREDRITIEKLL